MVIHEINRICKKIVWKGKHSKIPWDTITTLKAKGGLGLQNLEDINKTCNIKRIWNVLNNETLCAKWLNCRYANKGSLWDRYLNNNQSSAWKT